MQGLGDDLQDVMENLSEAIVLVEQEREVDRAERDRHANHLSHREYRSSHDEERAGAERQLGDARQALAASHAQR